MNGVRREVRNKSLEQHEGTFLLCGDREDERRWSIVQAVFEAFGPKSGFEFLGRNWPRFRHNGPLLSLVETALKTEKLATIRSWFQTPTEQAEYLALPQLLRCWRGCQDELGVRGLSWSTRRATATWFASGFHLPDRGGQDAPWLLANGVVRRRDLLGLKVNRFENEVIALPLAFVGPVRLWDLRAERKST